MADAMEVTNNVDKTVELGKVEANPFSLSAIQESVKWINLLNPTTEAEEVTKLRFLGVPAAKTLKIRIASYNVLATSHHMRKDDDAKFEFTKKYTRTTPCG